MKHLLTFIAHLLLTISTMAQDDTLSITLSPFTKLQGQSEILYVAVFIKSNIRDSIEIDDSRSWINCINAFGVKLVMETLKGGCYSEADKSDCHPTVSSSGDDFDGAFERIKLGNFAEYSYIVKVLPVVLVEESGLKRTIRNFNPYRFKLELPYKCGTQSGKVTSKHWTYYVHPR